MSATRSQNGRKMAKMLHNAAKKFDWVDIHNLPVKLINELNSSSQLSLVIKVSLCTIRGFDYLYRLLSIVDKKVTK